MEGKTSLLSVTSSGVPESLKIWLEDSKMKIFGSEGHKEKVLFYIFLNIRINYFSSIDYMLYFYSCYFLILFNVLKTPSNF